MAVGYLLVLYRNLSVVRELSYCEDKFKTKTAISSLELSLETEDYGFIIGLHTLCSVAMCCVVF